MDDEKRLMICCAILIWFECDRQLKLQQNSIMYHNCIKCIMHWKQYRFYIS